MNCLRFCIFEAAVTAEWAKDVLVKELWIAYVFVSLNQQLQPKINSYNTNFSCELLTFLYLWSSSYSSFSWCHENDNVVNCLRFCIFEAAVTAYDVELRVVAALWIAYVFVSLKQQLQLRLCNGDCKVCCELLTFLYLWSSSYSLPLHLSASVSVVNCLRFCIFEAAVTAQSV